MTRPTWVVSLWVLLGSAEAAPISVDIDGDGSVDSVELVADGVAVTTKAGTAKVPVKGSRVEAAHARGTPTIVVHMNDQAIVMQATQGTWKELVRVREGGVGEDADYGVAVTVTKDGVFRYQTRSGYVRCDAQPPMLFAERYEGGKFQRLSRLPIGIPDNAPVIAAKRDDASAPEPVLYRARIASHQPGASDASALAIPTELDDGKPATLWREEIGNSSGEGQFFTFKTSANARATQLRIVPGNDKNANRVQRIGIVGKNAAWHVDVPDAAKEPAGTAYSVDLPAPVEGCVTVVIESTHGTAAGKTAIAELVVYADTERADGGEALLASAVAAGKDGSLQAAQQLSRRGAKGVAAIDGELGKTTDPAARTRLVRALMPIRDPAAGPVLARAITQGWVHPNSVVDAIKALGGLGQAQALHDLAARSQVTLDARVAAARALQPSSDKERDLLIALAGRGPRELRQAVIERLTDVAVAVLAPAAQAQTSAPAAGDIWRAITRRAHARPDERAPALTAMTAALPAASDYERRYRLIDGVAAIGDAPALAQLGALLAKLPDDQETAAFKQIVARAIAVNPRKEATDLLVTLTRDRDPGVRLAALSAIASQTGNAAGPWHTDAGADGIDRVIITMLSTDTWPEVRRSAAQVLGGRCTRIGPAKALTDAVARDKDLGVRGDALAGLVECKAPGTSELLAKLWDDSSAPPELRQRAIDLAVTHADPALAAKLVGKFQKWRGGAIESEVALALAQNAAFALGRLAPRGAADALTAALDDSAFPEIVAAAATGLGLLGPHCTPAAAKKLQALTESDEQQVQTAARRAAGLCGKR